MGRSMTVAVSRVMSVESMISVPDFYPTDVELPQRLISRKNTCRTAKSHMAVHFSEEEDEDEENDSSDDSDEEKKPSACKTCMSTLRTLISKALVPPVVGSALGLIVALTPPVQGLFVKLPGPDRTIPLSFLFQAMIAIGKASVPVNMLVLGSNLSKGCDFGAIPKATNFGILFMKMIGQPIIMAALIAVLSRTIGGSISIWFVAMIVSCTPTANNIMVMVELSGQNKAGVTTSVFTQYMASPIVLTLVISGFLMGQDILMPVPATS